MRVRRARALSERRGMGKRDSDEQMMSCIIL